MSDDLQNDSQGTPEPTEIVYLSGPSWAPAYLAVGIMAMVGGIFANGYVVPAWVFSVVGALFVLGAVRSLVWRGAQAYFQLPRKQDAPAAVLPVASFKAPKN